MSIATELQRIVDTKKDLRKALNIDDSVPFSQYAAHIPWLGETPPANAKFFDFMNDRYSADGVPVVLPALGSTFTRLSSATKWKDEMLVDVAANVMRLDKTEGLLIEPQRTNILKNSSRPNLWTQNVGVTFSSAGNETTFIKSAGYSYIQQEDRGADFTGKALNRTWIAKTSNGAGAGINFGATPSAGDYVTIVDSNLRMLPPKPGQTSEHIEHGEWIENSFFSLSAPSAIGVASFRLLDSAGSSVTYIHLEAQVEEGAKTTIIRTGSSPVTRAKETFIVTLAPGQTITSDKDPGIVMTMLGNDAVFEGHGHLRYIWVD